MAYKSPVDLMNAITKAKEGWGTLPTENYKFDEKYENYNDYYGNDEPITRSEREFNLAASNDYPMYQHFVKNFPTYRKRIEGGEDYRNIINELHGKSETKSFNPKNIRKEYFMRLLNDPEWENN